MQKRAPLAPQILELTFSGRGRQPSTLARKRARSHETGAPKSAFEAETESQESEGWKSDYEALFSERKPTKPRNYCFRLKVDSFVPCSQSVNFEIVWEGWQSDYEVQFSERKARNRNQYFDLYHCQHRNQPCAGSETSPSLCKGGLF